MKRMQTSLKRKDCHDQFPMEDLEDKLGTVFFLWLSPWYDPLPNFMLNLCQFFCHPRIKWVELVWPPKSAEEQFKTSVFLVFCNRVAAIVIGAPGSFRIFSDFHAVQPGFLAMSYWWWKKSRTTWDVQNLVNNVINNMTYQLAQESFHQQFQHRNVEQYRFFISSIQPVRFALIMVAMKGESNRASVGALDLTLIAWTDFLIGVNPLDGTWRWVQPFKVSWIFRIIYGLNGSLECFQDFLIGVNVIDDSLRVCTNMCTLK